MGRCAANPKAGWTRGAGVDLPLETEEVQKGAGWGFSASRNSLGSPLPEADRRPTRGI